MGRISNLSEGTAAGLDAATRYILNEPWIQDWRDRYAGVVYLQNGRYSLEPRPSVTEVVPPVRNCAT